jgi:Rrf2 family transcriptional regulator, iron-sulfur cluster assembly transcription factor
MKINTKIRYGVRTMIEIASHDQNEGVLQKEIALNQQLPEKYLDSIISSLKASNLIINIGGKKSGYILKIPASKITVYDIYNAFEPELAIVHCINTVDSCIRTTKCITKEYWTGLNNLIITYLSSTSLEMLVKMNIKLDKKRKNLEKDLNFITC